MTEKPETIAGPAGQHRVLWTKPESDLAAQLWMSGKTAVEIAGMLGKSRNAVLGRIKRLGIRRSGRRVRQSAPARHVARTVTADRRQLRADTRVWNAERQARLVRLWKEGMATDEIAARLGCPEATVLARAVRAGLARAEAPERHSSPEWFARNDARFRTAMRRALDRGLISLPREAMNHGA